MNIYQLLELTISKDASDLHLLVGEPPILRIYGELGAIPGLDSLSESDFETLVLRLLSEHQADLLKKNLELDFGLDFENRGRYRVNVYKQRNKWAASFRNIPNVIRNLDALGLPQSLKKIPELRQGLILVTGPTGHGKTTTLASFINQINLTRHAHIITIEDPIEYTYPKSKSLISQREMNSDTHSWGNALKAALREDPDVVLIGEMRDLETISAAMTIAETGHLVFATLHTNSASQSVDRVIDVFPVNQQPQIRLQLASVLETVISQRLIPTIAPGRVLAVEVMFGTPAIKALIREAKTHLIDNMIQTSAELGMVNMESSLALLVREGKITAEIARNYALRPQLLNKLIT